MTAYGRSMIQALIFRFRKRVSELFYPFARKADDQIHIDVRHAGISRQMVLFDRFFHGMVASDRFQRFIFVRLRVNADAVDVPFFKTASFSSVIVSGRPASTVTSRMFFTSGNERYISSYNRSISSAVMLVGVPPPKYTVVILTSFSLSHSPIFASHSEAPTKMSRPVRLVL